MVKRGDLAQRALYVHLANVPDGERLTEEDFKLRGPAGSTPTSLGACAAIAHGLRVEKTLKLKTLPRLAQLLPPRPHSLRPPCGRSGNFAARSPLIRPDATEDVIEGEKAAFQLSSVHDERDEWDGTATPVVGRACPLCPLSGAEGTEAAYAKATEAGKVCRTGRKSRKPPPEAREAQARGRATCWARVGPKAANALSGQAQGACPPCAKPGVVIDDGPILVRWTPRRSKLDTCRTEESRPYGSSLTLLRSSRRRG